MWCLSKSIIAGGVETFRDSHLHLLGGEYTCPTGTVTGVLLLQGSVLEVCPHMDHPH